MRAGRGAKHWWAWRQRGVVSRRRGGEPASSARADGAQGTGRCALAASVKTEPEPPPASQTGDGARRQRGPNTTPASKAAAGTRPRPRLGRRARGARRRPSARAVRGEFRRRSPTPRSMLRCAAAAAAGRAFRSGPSCQRVRVEPGAGQSWLVLSGRAAGHALVRGDRSRRRTVASRSRAARRSTSPTPAGDRRERSVPEAADVEHVLRLRRRRRHGTLGRRRAHRAQLSLTTPRRACRADAWSPPAERRQCGGCR